MKILTNKNNFKKIAILLIVIMSFNFIVPINNVEAKSLWLAAGGDLLDPIVDLLMYIGDAILNLLQQNFLSVDDILIPANSEEFGNFNGWAAIGIAIGILVLLIGICILVPVFSGAVFAAGTAAGAGLVTTITAGAKVAYTFAIGAAAVGGGVFLAGGSVIKLNEDFKGEFDIPIIQYTPYTIFSGQIPALDVNFIKPMDDIEKNEKKVTKRTVGRVDTEGTDEKWTYHGWLYHSISLGSESKSTEEDLINCWNEYVAVEGSDYSKLQFTEDICDLKHVETSFSREYIQIKTGNNRNNVI